MHTSCVISNSSLEYCIFLSVISGLLKIFKRRQLMPHLRPWTEKAFLSMRRYRRKRCHMFQGRSFSKYRRPYRSPWSSITASTFAEAVQTLMRRISASLLMLMTIHVNCQRRHFRLAGFTKFAMTPARSIYAPTTQ